MPSIVSVRRSILLLLLTPAVAGFGQETPRQLLSHLAGRWSMEGTVLNKPVKYAAEGAWTLQEQFLSFHMKDVSMPPLYEANLLIGIDSARGEFVAHWLDSFGGAGARVVGFGPLAGDSVRIIYPYAEGRFRNTFGYIRARDAWTLLIESQESTGTWSRFAQYAIIRRR
jgi:hypothetical protein